MSDPARDEEEQAVVDRLFAELVAAYERTATAADRVDPQHAGPDRSQPADVVGDIEALDAHSDAATEPAVGWDDGRRAGPPPAALPAPRPVAGSDLGDEAPDHEAYERYRPAPPPPWRRPRWPALVGWGGIGWAVVIALLAIFGLALPTWIGLIAAVAFLGGFCLLVTQLPRHRPPDAGDGAVL